MITKAEWLEWKDSKVTRQLVELIQLGVISSREDLLAMRGEVGDFPRGASNAFEEIIQYIKSGEGIYSEEE